MALQNQDSNNQSIFQMEEGREYVDNGQGYSQQYQRLKHQIVRLNGPFAEQPSPRFGHIAVCYKNKMYIYGGTPLDENEKISNEIIYSFCFQKKVWTKLQTRKLERKDFLSFKAKYGAAIGSRLYVFGTIFLRGERPSMWRLTLDGLEWTKLDLKVAVPALYEGSCFFSLQKTFLMYFGGHRRGEFSNQIYLYNTHSQAWHLCSGNYLNSLKVRAYASMICLNSKVYLFGGYYPGSNGLQQLNDFYEIKVTIPYKGASASAEVRLINTEIHPSPRGGHFMVATRDSDICIFGGKRSQKYEKSVWHFSLVSREWLEIGSFEGQDLEREGCSVVQEKGNVWIFGGLKEEKGSIVNELVNIRIDWSSLGSSSHGLDTLERNIQNMVFYEPSCKLCYEKKHNFMSPSILFSNSLIDGLKQMIEFPFAAIGLLTDNAVYLGATNIEVRVQGTQNNHFIRIDDNGKINWSQQELTNLFANIGAQTNPILTGCDKKTKKGVNKSNAFHEYGSNLKLGCLRLGKRFLFISFANKEMRVAYCYKKVKQVEGNSEDISDQEYTLDYYSLDMITKELTDEYMVESRQTIDQKYYKYIKQVMSSKNISNSVFIFDTIIDDPEEYITLNDDLNDVFFGNPSLIQILKGTGYAIHECIDVSLRAYLSSLYLRSDALDITLMVGHVPACVSLQYSLEKVDRLKKSDSVIELEDIIEFDFKHAQFYYLKQMKKNNNFFSNGVLLYYRNRLITRFRPKLGTMINSILTETSGFFNYLPLFGFAELPEGVIVNPFKTNFSFDIMLDRLYSRLKFVEESFKKKIGAQVVAETLSEANKRREKMSSMAAAPLKQLPWKLRRHQQKSISYNQIQSYPKVDWKLKVAKEKQKEKDREGSESEYSCESESPFQRKEKKPNNRAYAGSMKQDRQRKNNRG